MRPCLLALPLLLFTAPAPAAEPAGFPLRDGDTWVMAGDSITAQHLHSNYFEAFCFARYPKMTFRFRNSGVGGHTIPTTMARFDYDIAVWKPTVVSVELGMNDQGGYTVEKYIQNMAEFDAMIRKIGARPVYFTASPINNGDTMKKLGGNTKLNAYADALRKFAAEKNSPFADQFHQLIDVWGANKPDENLYNTLMTVRKLAADNSLEGVQHLRMFLDAHARKSKPLVSMQGDPVHPGAPGQLMMAAALLKDLGAEPFVSNVIIADGKAETKGCTVTDLTIEGGTIRFTRQDECLPFPIPDDARAVLPLFPTILDLSKYTLTVKGLKRDYKLTVNGVALGTVEAADLEKGVNLTAFPSGPIADQGKAVLNAVAAKEGAVGQVRGMSKAALAPGAAPEMQKNLEAAMKRVEEADAKIRETAKPKMLKFELTPVK
jgi:lysophospholipase L1-like esterase